MNLPFQHIPKVLCLHLSAKVLRLAAVLKNAQLALRGPLRAKKKIPQTTSLNCWHMAGWMFLHQSVTLASECRSRKRIPFNLLFLFHCFLQCWFIFPVLSWQERQSVWSSAAVVHQLQGFNMFWMLWLWRVVIFSCYCLPFRLKQSGHSLQASGINKSFLLRELLLTGYFLFFGPFSINPRDGPVGKSLEISSYWNNKAEISGVSY